jgi:SLT domain-containing protein
VVPGLRKNNISNYDFAEVVEEEKQEDEICLNIRNRQARFKMIQDKNEFNMNKKRNRSQEHRNKELGNPLIYAFGDVSENEEEQISDTSSVKHQTNKNKKFKRGQTYSIGYLSKTIW